MDQLVGWVVAYPVENYKSRDNGASKLPAFEVRGKAIATTSDLMPIERLNPVEEYIGQLFFIRGKNVTQRFDNWMRNAEISNQLERLRRMTRRGKVWVDGNGCVLALEIQDVHEDYKIRRLKQHSVVSAIFANDRPWDSDVITPLVDLQVKQDTLTKEAVTTELLSFCKFFEGVTHSRIGTGEVGLSVSGWNLNDMEEPNELIRMLADRYQEIILLVEPKTGVVRFLRAIRH